MGQQVKVPGASEGLWNDSTGPSQVEGTDKLTGGHLFSFGKYSVSTF